MKFLISNYIHRPRNHFNLIFAHMFFALFPVYLLAGILRIMGYGNLGLVEGQNSNIKEAVLFVFFTPFFSFILSLIFWILYVIGNTSLRLIYNFEKGRENS